MFSIRMLIEPKKILKKIVNNTKYISVILILVMVILTL